MIFVGYDENSKAYRCYDADKKRVIISQDVTFNELQLGITKLIAQPISVQDFFPRDLFSSVHVDSTRPAHIIEQPPLQQPPMEHEEASDSHLNVELTPNEGPDNHLQLEPAQDGTLHDDDSFTSSPIRPQELPENSVTDPISTTTHH